MYEMPVGVCENSPVIAIPILPDNADNTKEGMINFL